MKKNARVLGVRLWSMFGLAAMVGGAQAAQDAALSEQDFFAETPVVLSVSRLSQPVAEAPSAVTIIDRDMIRTSGAREIVDLFRLVPGFYSGQFNGNERIVSHGITSRYFGRIQVLVDGRSVYTPLDGQVPWSTIPLSIEDIERIEVTRGPNAASYGANSYVGVINIMTRHPQADRGVTGLIRLGEQGVGDAMVRVGASRGDLDYGLTFGYQSDDGLATQHDFKRVAMFSGRTDYRLSQSDDLQIRLGFSVGRLGTGYDVDPVNPSRTRTAEDGFLQVRWHRVLGVDDDLSLHFYSTISDTHESARTRPFGQVLATTLLLDNRAERYDLEFQRSQPVASAVRLVWGASARLDRVTSPLYLGTDSSMSTKLYRLFGNVEWRATQSLVVNVGAMGETNSVSGGDVSPRGSVSYRFAPGQTLRLGVSVAQRTPTLLENMGNYSLVLPIAGFGNLRVPKFIGPGNLKAERVESREIAYLGEWPAMGLQVDVRAYSEKMTEIVNATGQRTSFGSLYFVFGNLNSARLDGVESQIGWRGRDSRIWFTHAYRRASSPSEEIARAVAPHLYGILASHRLDGGIEASVGFHHVGPMFPIGDGARMHKYNQLDLRLAKQFKVGGSLSEIALVAQNVTGRYLDYNQSNAVDRRLFATFRTAF